MLFIYPRARLGCTGLSDNTIQSGYFSSCNNLKPTIKSLVGSLSGCQFIFLHFLPNPNTTLFSCLFRVCLCVDRCPLCVHRGVQDPRFAKMGKRQCKHQSTLPQLNQLTID
ncbi:hypothetical protein CDL12_19789 [Handroanthus impetiginosus]|uniref:Uncharacterized protein n=1 Tax=Handroanthus impetiginosus TaxID=429701 RepID=A0A2G9GQR6_9LAMI|nr:hypothetical protein CDL12_19789 [Handroanthus impetiginosus]